jgi:tRNA G46 methylase TrmB
MSFLELVFGAIKPGGRVVFVTDNESYFASAKEVFNEFENLELSIDDWDVPLTSYHRRAIRLNHKISQLSARKI